MRPGPEAAVASDTYSIRSETWRSLMGIDLKASKPAERQLLWPFTVCSPPIFPWPRRQWVSVFPSKSPHGSACVETDISRTAPLRLDSRGLPGFRVLFGFRAYSVPGLLGLNLQKRWKGSPAGRELSLTSSVSFFCSVKHLLSVRSDPPLPLVPGGFAVSVPWPHNPGAHSCGTWLHFYGIPE